MEWRFLGYILFISHGTLRNIYPALSSMEEERLISKKKNSKTGGFLTI
jgi:DNA-binding PadR family transcriptional regulator